MLLQQHFSRESLSAFGTFMGLYSRVNPNVHVKRDSLVKGLWAMGTDVLLAISMDFQVAAQITFVVEHFPALRAVGSEFFGPFMDRHVILVVSQLGEFLPTLIALVTSFKVEQTRSIRRIFLHRRCDGSQTHRSKFALLAGTIIS